MAGGGGGLSWRRERGEEMFDFFSSRILKLVALGLKKKKKILDKSVAH